VQAQIHSSHDWKWYHTLPDTNPGEQDGLCPAQSAGPGPLPAQLPSQKSTPDLETLYIPNLLNPILTINATSPLTHSKGNIATTRAQ